jgi:SepF-like predicted cell division protein (DUF552 family)
MMVRATIRRTTAVAVALSFLLTGCAGDDNDLALTGSDDAGEPAGLDGVSGVDLDVETATEDRAWATDADEPAETDTADDGEADDAAGSDQAGPSTTAVTLGRRVVRTATLELESADPNRLSQELTRTVNGVGGFVATSDLRRDEQGVLRGTVTVRVPSEALDATLDDLEELADNAPVRRIDERDVTVESADLAAQLENLTAYETELRSLLADVRETTTRPEDLLTVFERIRQVRAEIDQLQGRLAILADQVSLATITVTITPTTTALPVADPTWQPGDTARSALTAAARTLSGLADAAIWFGLAILPVLAVLAVPAGAVLLMWRRRQRERPTPPPSGSTPPPSGSAPPPAGSSPPPGSAGPTTAAPTAPVA